MSRLLALALVAASLAPGTTAHAATAEFAGAWVEDGALVVALTRPEAAAAETARDELADELGRPDLHDLDVVVRQARWSFAALQGWHDAVTAGVLALPGAVSTDVDERANVVRVGTSDPAGTEARIRAVARAHGVPAQALVVGYAEPVVPELRDITLPVVGGVEIGFARVSVADLFVCTLGFPAVRGGVAGFVVNSHCTDRRGAVDPTVYTQPLVGPPVGVEIADPPHFTGGGCPAGRSCRYSDTAFASLAVPALYNQGHVARPPLGSTSWNGTDTFRITGEAAPLAGETLTKVGRTTGRGAGAVTATCANVNVSGSSITMICQGQAGYGSAGGDSGSPVFAITSGNDVALKGIHWGSGGVFSPVDGIQRQAELGPMDTCAAGFSC